jgi:hypothetical protein
MSKKKNYITTPAKQQTPTPVSESKKPNFTVIIVIVLVFLVFSFLLVKYFTDSEPSNTKSDTVLAPSFKKEGELAFVRANEKDTIQKLDIEIADNDAERAQGLMYRPSMPENQGMLFIFQTAEPQQFWMKNTVMSLDIIYVGADNKIISIQRHAKPFSEDPLPSEGSALYVVEVNAGFSEKFHIDKGDMIKFVKTSN